MVNGLQRPSRARSAHDLVAHGIGQDIMQGRFPIGSTLPGDAELMELFGVSRTALREALKTLAAKGLIESKTKVGTKVLDRNNWNMFDSDILGVASRARRRCQLPWMAVRDQADPRAACLRHRGPAADTGATQDHAQGAAGDVQMRDQQARLHQSRPRVSIKLSSRRRVIRSCNPSAPSSGPPWRPRSRSARPFPVTTASER